MTTFVLFVYAASEDWSVAIRSQLEQSERHGCL